MKSNTKKNMKGEHVDHYTSLVSRMNLSSMDLCVIDI